MRPGLALFLRALAWTYLVAGHLAVAAFVLSSEFRGALYWRLPPHGQDNALWRNMVGAQARLDATLAPGAVVFLGDSGVQSLDVGSVARRAVNYGIGLDTAAGVRHRLPRYRSLPSARAIVLLVGSNDLMGQRPAEAAQDYDALLNALPAGTTLIAVAVLPMDERAGPPHVGWRSNPNIAELNAAIGRLCAARSGCSVVDIGAQLRDATGNLRADMHEGDGLHLAPAGYRLLIERLRAALGD